MAPKSPVKFKYPAASVLMASRLLRRNCNAGWLLRLTGDAKLREEFETLHQAVLELLKVRRAVSNAMLSVTQAI